MYQEERIYKILEILKAKKTMTNQEIMDQFHISRDTARRDIVRLVSENLAVRTHGGITLNDVHQIGNYQTRKQENEEIKNEIGKIAVSLIENNKVIFFDTSTTVAALCQYVESDIEAYSHSLDNIEILSIKLLGIIPEDEYIVISTNRGEPAITNNLSLASTAYRNIIRRLMGEEVPLMKIEINEGFFGKIKKLLKI